MSVSLYAGGFSAAYDVDEYDSEEEDDVWLVRRHYYTDVLTEDYFPRKFSSHFLEFNPEHGDKQNSLLSESVDLNNKYWL